MRRVLPLLVVLCALPALAGEGVYVTLEAGYGMWNKDDFKKSLSSQLGTDPVTGYGNSVLLVDRQMPDGALGAIHLGYNIGGHVAIEGSLMMRPYDLLADTRGVAGMAGAAVRWYPLQGLVRPGRSFDISFLGGMDYILSGGNGIHGPTINDTTSTGKIANSGRGFDGMAAEFGATLELYPTRGFSIGITPRYYVIDPIRYFVSFDDRNTNGSIPINGRGGLSMLSISLSLTFHFEPLPD